MIVFFGNFPETMGMSWSLENCETIQKLYQVVCGNDCIIFFLKSRLIYVNVDSPNLGFPYLKNGKKPKHDQHCGQTNFFCSDQYPLEILACEAFLLKSAAFFSNQKVCEPLLY